MHDFGIHMRALWMGVFPQLSSESLVQRWEKTVLPVWQVYVGLHGDLPLEDSPGGSFMVIPLIPLCCPFEYPMYKYVTCLFILISITAFLRFHKHQNRFS